MLCEIKDVCINMKCMTKGYAVGLQMKNNIVNA